MGCSNARLLVQAPLTSDAGSTDAPNPLSSSSMPTSPISLATDSHSASTRMHLTGVDLVVERNGSYTLLLTPKTHKQLMPYVLRKKRFRILVDKTRSHPASSVVASNEPVINERLMETSHEGKFTSKKEKNHKEQTMASTVESIEQVATDEMNRAKARFVGGRSIDRGNPEDDDVNIQSDDEGMIEETVTTVEEDKDLECKVKKKIETKKTIAQDPETHSKITKVVKTEMTEVTRTITINDQHDLARAKRELGIDDVNRFLPSASSPWTEQSRSHEVQEKRYEPNNEVVTSGDFPSANSTKQSRPNDQPALAEATTVGRGAVVETIAPLSSSPKAVVATKEQKSIEKAKKKKKKSGLCSCTRAADDDVPQPTTVAIPDRSKEFSLPTSTITATTTTAAKPTFEPDTQGQSLVSSDIKQLIIEKKFLLIDYIHSTLFSPAKLFSSPDEDFKARKISSRILDLLRYDRCASWSQLFEQLQEEYPTSIPTQTTLQPMVKTYENLFTQKQANLVNTFSTIHHENDLRNISENHDYLTMLQTYLNEPDNQTTISAKNNASGEDINTGTATSHERFEEHLQPESRERLDEKVPMDDEQQVPVPDKEPVYNEAQLVKMLADVSQHKPITLAEAIAYQYIDIEDPKLGLDADTIDRLKKLFRPLSDENSSNVIRVKRAGEYLTDVNLAELNPFEKLNLTEPLIYQLQQSFEPTLDFNEKQFRSLTETLLNNKEQYEQLQFDIARTSLPVDDLKESSTNDFSQSDSGYSMTTATYESLASKIKIEFEPLNQEVPTLSKRDDLYEEEKIDLDKATADELQHYQLNHDLIQIIKSDFNGTDKTVRQAILSRDLRLDSSDAGDVAHLKALGIDKEQAKILSAFFFPKQTRIIAYSPEPGRFVEAQTTFNPDYPSHKTDTTIIQIQEKQLSSDLHAMQRQIYDDRTSPISSKSIQESELLVSSPSADSSSGVKKDKSSPPPAPTSIERKKRKSTSSASLLSCFKNKKPKAGTEQQGQPTVAVNEPVVTTTSSSSRQEKPMVDYAILPDGKRIYIDAFRERPGMDMSYKPNDFDERFILPTPKPADEYERPMTPETESTVLKSEIIDERPVSSEPEPVVIPDEPTKRKLDVLEEKPIVASESVMVQSKPAPVVLPPAKTKEISVIKSPGLNLHAAAVQLPEVELVKPGPLPTFPTTKGKKVRSPKKSTGGLCASCFGGKSAEKKKRDVVSTAPIPAPLEPKSTTNIQEEQPASSPPVQSSIESSAEPDAPILPRVNIDTFRERTFPKNAESTVKTTERPVVSEQRITTTVELNQSAPPPVQSVPSTKVDASIFSQVNIDTFKERTFPKGAEAKKPKDHTEPIVERVVPTEEPRQESSADELIVPASLPLTSSNESITTEGSAFGRVNIDTFKERTFPKPTEKPRKASPAPTEQVVPAVQESTQQPLANESTPSPPLRTDVSLFSQVNIDTFKERNFQKSAEQSPKKAEEPLEVSVEQPVVAEVPQEQPSTDEHVVPPTPSPPIIPVEPSERPALTKDASMSSKVNIDTFKERTFDRTYENRPKSLENPAAQPAPVEEPHYQLPTNEPILTNSASTQPSSPSTATDASAFSRVNIDTFRERTFVKSGEKLPKTDEPYYQLPSSEPVPPAENEYSVADHPEDHTYDTPRSIELQQTSAPADIPSNEKIISEARMIPATSDIDKSSGDFHPIEQIKSELVPQPETKVSKKKKKKSKDEKKSGVLSTIFRSNAAPAFDLPSIDLDLSPNNALRSPHRRDSDPLRVPNNTLPPPDVQLPIYSRPEADMTGGQRQLTSEFAIPAVRLPTIPNLDLPTTDKSAARFSIDQMRIPQVQLPELEFTSNEEVPPSLTRTSFKSSTEKKLVERPTTPTIETGLALASPVEDMLSIQTDHKNFPIETDYAVKTNSTLPELVSDNTEIVDKAEPLSIEEKYTITDTRFVQSSEPSILIDKPTNEELKSSAPPSNYSFPLPSPDPVQIIAKDSSHAPPSFDDDVPAAPSKLVPAVDKQLIETKSKTKKKSSTLPFCSCFGKKSAKSKETSSTLTAPTAALPAVDMPVPSSNISSTLKNKGPLRAPTADLPAVDLTPKDPETIHLPGLGTKRQETSKSTNDVQVAAPTPVIQQAQVSASPPTAIHSDLSQSAIPKTSVDVNKSNASTSVMIKAPTMNIPQVDLSGPTRSDSYTPLSKSDETRTIQSRSDSGFEAAITSPVKPSSTFGTLEDIPQHPSVSSGFGSEVLDSITTKGYSLPGLKVTGDEFTGPISMTGGIHAELNSRQDQLKQTLGDAISQSVDDFDAKKDRKALDKMLPHAIDLIKTKEVTTYGDLQRKLTVEHKDEAYLVDPIVRSLYCTIEKQGFDQVDKSEFLSAIRDMVRLPGKQTSDTGTGAKKETTSLGPIQMTKETPASQSTTTTAGEKKSSTLVAAPVNAARSCFTCGRTKSKSALPSPMTNAGLLDDRRRAQLNTHRNELGDILRDHLQSAQPPIRKFADHPKETEKIIRKSLTSLNQPKILSYEQLRHEGKTEFKSTFYLVDPIVDIIRDTLDHCDLTQMTDKTNLDILNSHISQTAQLYNHQQLLLTSDEGNAVKSSQLSWLHAYLLEQESKEKKLTRKQSKELSKILTRALEILSLNVVSTWEELALQLQREFPKAHDLCHRAVDLLKQGHRDGLFSLQQAPNQQDTKRRPSSLITERAKQNLKSNRTKISSSVKKLVVQQTSSADDERQLDLCLAKTLTYLEEHKSGQFKDYHELKEQLKRDFPHQRGQLIEQIVDVIEQAHASNQFDDIDKPEVQALMRDRLNGKPLVIKEMYVSLPPRIGGYGSSKHPGDDSNRYLSNTVNGDRTLNSGGAGTGASHRVGRGLSWREANERARILFYRGKHPAIHYDEQAAAFDVRMLLETASGGTQEIPVTDSDVHELLNSCGVQWDGVNIISLVDHSEDVVRAAEQAALRVIREKGLVDLRTPPPPTTDTDTVHHEDAEGSAS